MRLGRARGRSRRGLLRVVITLREMGILTRRACEVLGKTDSLAIAYDCNPLEIKELLSSTQVYKSDSTQKTTGWEREVYSSRPA